MDRHEAHWDVAAYALGVLDHGEIEQYERHLADCATCAAELEYLLPASRLLADVDPGHIRTAVDIQLIDRLLGAVRVDRNRGRRRQRVMIAVGTAFAAAATAGVVLAGAAWLDSAPTDEGRDVTAAPSTTAEPAPQESERPDGLPSSGELVSVTDPDTGVEVNAVLESNDWGTEVWFEISAVTGPRECQLLLVHADGTEEVIGSWRVPEAGYGTPEQPNPLLLRAATAADRNEIAQLQIEEFEQDGSTSTLASVPL